MGDYFLLQDRM